MPTPFTNLPSNTSGNFTLPGLKPASTPLSGLLNKTAPPVTPIVTPTSPSTPVKSQKITNLDGSTHETTYHAAPKTTETASGSSSNTSTPITAPTTPPAYNTTTGLLTDYGRSKGLPEVNGQQTPNIGNGLIPGEQTSTGAQSNPGLLPLTQNNSGNVPTATSGLYGKAIANANTLLNESQQFDQAYNQGTNNIYKKPIPLEFQQGQAAALQRDYGTQQQALSEQAKNATTIAGLAAPQLTSYSTQAFNPVDSTFSGSGVPANDLNSLASAVNSGTINYSSALGQLSSYGPTIQNQLLPAIQKLNPNFNVNTNAGVSSSQTDLSGKYQQGLAQLRAAANIEPAIVQTLQSNPSLNQTPISALTNLNQWFAGQTSNPAQQQLSSQVASYISALGLSPDQAAAIASQKGGTIGTLLKTLKDNATAQNEGNNPANISSGSTSSGGVTGQNPWH